MKNVAYTSVGNLFIAVHNRNSPSDAEFPRVIETFRKLDFETVRMLVITEGGGPTPVQRKQMNDVLHGHAMPTAVVSDDIVIRGTVTALSWFNKKVKVFRVAALDEALEYLEIHPTRFEAIQQQVHVLRDELERSKPKSMAAGR